MNKWLSEAGVYLKEGTLVDVIIIGVPTTIKNKARKRDPDIHQTKKGNQWRFGMRAYIGADARVGLIHTFTTTAANEHDLNQTKHLIHGNETFISADSGYRGVQKREELKGVTAQ